MARINVIGGTGYAGGNLVEQAVAAGHQVTSFSRSAPEQRIDGVEYVTGSILDPEVARRAVTGTDVVVSALSPRGPMEGQTRGAVAELARLAGEAGTRIGVIGGAGSLQVVPGGPKVVETEGFPDEIKAEATEMGAILDDLRASDESIDWFFVSPAGGFGAFAPGEKTGKYRVGGDVLLVDDEGNSNISGADLALAVVAEIEKPEHHRQRFTVAY